MTDQPERTDIHGDPYKTRAGRAAAAVAAAGMLGLAVAGLVTFETRAALLGGTPYAYLLIVTALVAATVAGLSIADAVRRGLRPNAGLAFGGTTAAVVPLLDLLTRPEGT